jgi:hypothetical protein
VLNIYFFTEVECESSNYCLLHVSRYNSPLKLKKKEILVDPGVWQLKKRDEYSKIEFLHQLASGSLAPNEWISIDYPPTMNEKLAAEFVKRSVENNLKYAANEKYICTIQYYPRNAKQFLSCLKELSPVLENPKKMFGIGFNIGKSRFEMNPDVHTNLVFHYIMKEMTPRRIHLYGPAETVIEKYVPMLERKNFVVSVDSTKWTRASTKQLKKKYGLQAKKNIEIFFKTYMRKLSNRMGIDVEY